MDDGDDYAHDKDDEKMDIHSFYPSISGFFQKCQKIELYKLFVTKKTFVVFLNGCRVTTSVSMSQKEKQRSYQHRK